MGKKIATLAKNRMDEFAEKTSGRKKIGAASKWRNVQAAASGGGSDRSKSTSGTTVDAKPVASSMSAGLIYSVITMPFETAKNRMAFQKPDAAGKLPYNSTVQTISSVARAEGPLALWNGFLPYYGRCGGHTVTMFIAVDQLRVFYRKFNEKPA